MTVRNKFDLLKLSPFNTSQYANYPLTTLTAYSVFWLHEWEIITSLENITVASHRMFPAKFALVGWPQFPDLNRTNRSVLQMRPKHRNLASSATAKGVFLNHNGIQEAKALIDRIGFPVYDGQPVASSVDVSIKVERGTGKARSVHSEDLLKTIHNSQLFNMFLQSRLHEAEAIHLIGLLGVYDHTPSREKKRKLKEFLNAAEDLHDEKTVEFLRIVAERFHKYLNK